MSAGRLRTYALVIDMELTMTLAYDFTDDRPASALTAAFDRLGQSISVARNEEIYAQEDGVELLYRLVRGVVRTSRLGADGRRQVGDFYYPGDVFGLEPGPDHRFGAEALTDCEIRAVRRSTVRAFAGDAELDRAILEATRREMERLQDHVLMLGRKSARERVASFLISLAQDASADRIDLPMGRQDMADYLGLTIETVSRMLTQLQGDAIVEFPSTRTFRVRRRNALEALSE
jgi:CRP/FNR family nitrogen fixation transcriptional regulator